MPNLAWVFLKCDKLTILAASKLFRDNQQGDKFPLPHTPRLGSNIGFILTDFR